jgi:hypothetical protein
MLPAGVRDSVHGAAAADMDATFSVAEPGLMLAAVSVR